MEKKAFSAISFFIIGFSCASLFEPYHFNTGMTVVISILSFAYGCLLKITVDSFHDPYMNRNRISSSRVTKILDTISLSVISSGAGLVTGSLIIQNNFSEMALAIFLFGLGFFLGNKYFYRKLWY